MADDAHTGQSAFAVLTTDEGTMIAAKPTQIPEG